MTRELDTLANTQFDLLVVGGGIYGTTAAWDATQRGLSVALIDQGDFGGATSFNSAKTVHGGVRTLQSGDIAELRRFVRERRALSRIVPHLVDPLPFVIPTYRGLRRHRRLLQLYFAMHDALAWDRNDGLDRARRLPASRLLSREECLALNPVIAPAAVTGGIEWHDCQMYNSDRVNLAFLLTAIRQGAMAANYVEAQHVRRSSDGHFIVGARDRLHGDDLEIRTRVVLNCAGPWAPTLVERLMPTIQPPLPRGLSVAMNVVVDRALVTTHAVGGPAGGRLVFMAPWRGRTIIGTSHDPYTGSPDDLRPTGRLVRKFLDDVNVAFPQAAISEDEITLIHRGLLPSVGGATSTVRLLKTSVVRTHQQDGAPGLISVVGVRYTTARDTAGRAIDAVFRALDRKPPPCRTDVTALLGGEIADVLKFVDETVRAPGPGSPSLRQRIARSYGSESTRLLRRLEARPDDARPLGASCDVTRGEVRHAVTDEMAVTLGDAILRRTEAGSAGYPGDDALSAAAQVMAEELGWEPARIDGEIEGVREVYRWTREADSRSAEGTGSDQ